MSNSLKAALLSGLVFPGAGQVSQKHYKRGIALMLMVLAGMLAIAVKAAQQAQAILEKIQFEGREIDMNAIINAATRESAASSGFIYQIALLWIIICWIVGVADAYRIGRKKDMEGR
jgi:hypothetical protein